MDQGHTTLYYIHSQNGDPILALTLSELRDRLEQGLIEDTQLIWNPTGEMWMPVNHVSWLKRTTVIELPQKPVKAPTPSLATHATTTLLPKAPLPSQSNPKIAYPVSQSKKQSSGKPIMIYPPKKTHRRGGVMENVLESFYFVWHRARKLRLHTITLFVCLAIVFLETNAWLLKSSFTGSSTKAPASTLKLVEGTPVRVTNHYGLYIKQSTNLIISLDDAVAKLPNHKLANLLTLFSEEMSEAPSTGELFDQVEIQFSNGQKYLIDGPAWKELSIFKDMAVEQRMQILSKYIGTMHEEFTKL